MRLLERKTIYRDGEYVAFPNVAWLDETTLACFFRHARERQKEWGNYTHIDPSAKDVYILSRDGGKTFGTELHTVLDDDQSEQDPCVTVLRDGRILVSCFRWQLVPEGRGAEIWGEELYRIYGRTRKGLWDSYNIGFHINISDDRGKTWRQGPVIMPEGYVPGSAVRGNILELPAGILLLPFYGCKKAGDLASCGVLKSSDRGETWEFCSEMACDPQKNFLEPNLFRTASGRIFGLIRTQSDFKKPGVNFEDTYLNLHIALSEDDGKTFAPAREIPSVLGSNCFHALQLRSGRVFLHYGYRHTPFGIRAKICDGELSDIEKAPEFIVCDDAPNGDLGYSHAVQLPDDSVLLVYYISGQDGIRKIEGAVIKEE
ncbi:MAG: glycoside hydrolase [Treponema sp.]|nr:glycoside hydrolase [Treponema sp.]